MLEETGDDTAIEVSVVKAPTSRRGDPRFTKAFCRDCQKIAVFDMVQDGVLIATLDYEVVWLNEAFRAFMSLPEGTRDLPLQDIFPVTSTEPHPWIAEIARGNRWRGDVVVALNGQLVDASMEVAANGSRVIFVVSDPRQSRAVEARLRHEVLRDDLTRLPNRTMFHEKLGFSLLEVSGSGEMAAILFFDLDRFKNINDSLGHEIGDLLLRAVAKRVGDLIPGNGSLYRLGGDEFAIVIDSTSREQVDHLAYGILSAVSNPFSINDYELLVTCSIGICFYPEHGGNISALLRHSDTALYEAKRAGRNRLSYYSSDMSMSAVMNFEVENGLRYALSRKEFSLVWHIQIDMGASRACGAEALIRWNSQQLGPVPPDKFIPIAEEMHIIDSITDWVLEEACQQLSCWDAIGMPMPRIAVNLSCVQLTDASLPARFKATLDRHGITPERIEIELTESAVMADINRSIVIISTLKEIGFMVSVDDFGTGHSNLGYLKNLPVDKIKIDRSFLADVPYDKGDVAITRSIIQLARSLGKDVLAEGVETVEQVNFLWSNHCHNLQGFFLAKPVPAHEVPGAIQIALGKLKGCFAQ